MRPLNDEEPVRLHAECQRRRLRRSPQNLVLISAAVVLVGISSSPTSVEGFLGEFRPPFPTSVVGQDHRISASSHPNFRHDSSIRPLHGGRRPSSSAGRRRCETPTAPRWSPLTLPASKGIDNDTWSSSASSSNDQRRKPGESRFGVRSRVRSVLAKAKKRTGIQNNSDASTTTLPRPHPSTKINTVTKARDVVAEAASIGGLGAVVVDDEGTVDVALDYVPGSALPEASLGTRVAGLAHGAGNMTNGAAAPSIATDGAQATTGTGKATTASGGSSPASTYSSPVSNVEPNPEDRLVPAGAGPSSVSSSDETRAAAASAKSSEVDALRADVSAAFSLPPPPLPFTLPSLTPSQQAQLDRNERVQFQDDMGREGSGFVVLDVKAPPSVVWDCLLDFHSYPETIPTVRDVTMYTNTHLKSDYRAESKVDWEDGTYATLKHGVPSVTRASFTLSKFRLNIAAVHKYRPHPMGDYMVFTLDPACTNLVLRSAKGVWHTQSNPDGKGEEYTRVWLLCEVKVSRALPSWITDYAAKRAMPRATTWLKPQVEAAASLWLKPDDEEEDER